MPITSSNSVRVKPVRALFLMADLLWDMFTISASLVVLKHTRPNALGKEGAFLESRSGDSYAEIT